MIELSFCWLVLNDEVRSVSELVLLYINREPSGSVLVKLLCDEGRVLLNAFLTIILLIERLLVHVYDQVRRP